MWMWPPVSLASSRSRETMISSCSRGMPLMPSIAETRPSFICPPRHSEQSWEWLMTKLPKCFEYSSAYLITSLLATGRPSSLNATAPACVISPISTHFLPSILLVIAPIGSRSMRPRAFALATISRVTTALSFTGFVFAIGQQVVTPPATAVSEPVFISSLYSRPGSRKCTCISISPGITSLPLASITLSAAGSSAVIRVILSPSIRTFAFCELLWFTIVPFLMRVFILRLCF